MRAPIVRHLIGLMLISCELVKEILRVEAAKETILVDLFDVQRTFRCVRVPDLEVDGVYRAFLREIGSW